MKAHPKFTTTELVVIETAFNQLRGRFHGRTIQSLYAEAHEHDDWVCGECGSLIDGSEYSFPADGLCMSCQTDRKGM